MASSSVSKSFFQTRSISFPSRSHSKTNQFEQQLYTLRSSQAASTSSSSSVSHRLNSLKDLYDNADELLQLPSNQLLLSKNKHTKSIEEVLSGSLRLLEICGTSRDVLQQSKERLQDIQSVLRRRSNGEFSIANEVTEYLNTRKKAKKTIKKCLRDIKEAHKNTETNAIVSMLKDTEAITTDNFKSFLSYIAGAKLQSQKSSWSAVSKLISQSGNKEAAALISEFDIVDDTLDLLIQKKKTGINVSQVEDMKRQMIKLESEIQDFDEALECLFRHLVRTRATLLNILSN
ncbi:uncharacterized protein LOC110736919 [Chenopodium quinoa]|uniref:Uncharacterized protein n=1 Tax=Chenopodium quinoa TaxID=63459 RepID=A0A803LG50_CHEQI|nr:uncharacterized protein LOC110736919 [Chenopodium quinoa]